MIITFDKWFKKNYEELTEEFVEKNFLRFNIFCEKRIQNNHPVRFTFDHESENWYVDDSAMIVYFIKENNKEFEIYAERCYLTWNK